jgi:hypothetical protein
MERKALHLLPRLSRTGSLCAINTIMMAAIFDFRDPNTTIAAFSSSLD